MNLHHFHSRRAHGGFTLLELVLVIGVLVAIAGLYFARMHEVAANARSTACSASLVALRDAIVGAADRPGFRNDLGELPVTPADLYRMPLVLPSGATVAPYEPLTQRGWNGPYANNPSGVYVIDGAHGFTNSYGAAGDPCFFDGWGRAIVLQAPQVGGITPAEREQFTRLVSAGADGVIHTLASVLAPDISSPADVGDDIVLYLLRVNGP